MYSLFSRRFIRSCISHRSFASAVAASVRSPLFPDVAQGSLPCSSNQTRRPFPAEINRKSSSRPGLISVPESCTPQSQLKVRGLSSRKVLFHASEIGRLVGHHRKRAPEEALDAVIMRQLGQRLSVRREEARLLADAAVALNSSLRKKGISMPMPVYLPEDAANEFRNAMDGPSMCSSSLRNTASPPLTACTEADASSQLHVSPIPVPKSSRDIVEWTALMDEALLTAGETIPADYAKFLRSSSVESACKLYGTENEKEALCVIEKDLQMVLEKDRRELAGALWLGETWGVCGRLDAVTLDRHTIVEVKCRISRIFENLPLYEYIQVQSYLHMFPDSMNALVVQYIPDTREQSIFSVPRDTSFWNTCVDRLQGVAQVVQRILAMEEKEPKCFSSKPIHRRMEMITCEFAYLDLDWFFEQRFGLSKRPQSLPLPFSLSSLVKNASSRSHQNARA
ncbi:putative mitochondrial protein [Andalucia godoyi]|uniref:Putative mitochondrial protein n=1 Tax=Andalucia godoyi TaxID=505711 RepID=A0A8K0AI04_ANDGO|nr:putative mitochondrial protein [Andalucia godoyi]|eukprot:ANDGO_02559.mRNA.1 putative mitochondrial protein